MKIDFDLIHQNLRMRKYSLIGSGSGRIVYDLGNGYVVKVAKNRKGIIQNKSENQIYSMNDSEYFAKVLAISDNLRYLVMEKAERIGAFSMVLNNFQVRNNRELSRSKEFQQFTFKNNLLLGDLFRRSSWGMIKGKLVIIDYGFTREARKYYRIF